MLCLGTTVATASEPALTREQYVRRVVESGLAAKVLDARAEQARAELAGQGLWSNPSLRWERQKNAQGVREGESQDLFVALVPLVPSGRLGLERQAADERAQAAALNAVRARAALALDAERAFSRVIAQVKRRRILEASVESLARLADVIRARERAGEAAGYDRLRIEVEAESVKSALMKATIDEEAALAEAALLLSDADRASLRLEGELDVSSAVPDAPLRADVRALEVEEASAESSRRAAARSFLPELTLAGGAQLLDLGRPQTGAGYVVSVELSLPLFDHGQGAAARAAALKDRASAERAWLNHAIELSLTAIRRELQLRRELLAHHQKAIGARAAELSRIAQAAYRGGAGELLAVVDAERVARDAQLQTVDLSLDVADTAARALFIAGAYDARAAEELSNR